MSDLNHYPASDSGDDADAAVETALAQVIAACRELDADDTRGVLLAVSELYDLGLRHIESDGPMMSIDDVAALTRALRGEQS